ncbi:MAG TPA: M23 family metallopeptidase [Myxococcota bacterium]|nr:M23 family metallopeptidase [Myxococcota bacterium]
MSLALSWTVGVAALDAAHAASPAAIAGAAAARAKAADPSQALQPGAASVGGSAASAPAQPAQIEGVLERGQSLARSLAARGVAARSVDQIAREMRGHFDFRRSQPGHSYRLALAPSGEVESFHYRISPVIAYELRRGTDGSYSVSRNEAELFPRQAMIAGIITSSLYGAITDLGGEPQLASDFADVFAYDVDFSRMIRAGDEFRILYERLFRHGRDGREVFVRPGRILAARYGGANGEHTAVYFEAEQGRGGYYRPDGSLVERQFLMAPVQYARVTSKYSLARRHPILNVTRPHQGIDYAAPAGTPVFAVARGEVIYKSWAGGFGNLVKIRHDDGYVSYYGHLSRFSDGLRVGQPVGQKQVIGYVGSTGLSTGPHVCFRVARDGKYVNPIHLPSPAGAPLPDEFKPTFQVYRDTLLAALDSGRLVASDEAL